MEFTEAVKAGAIAIADGHIAPMVRYTIAKCALSCCDVLLYGVVYCDVRYYI